MAKDDRVILHGISAGIPKEKTGLEGAHAIYVPGMEDELAAYLSQEELDAAVERGDLTGTWKHLSAASAAKAEKAKEAASKEK